MPQIPKDDVLDSSVALQSEGYEFVAVRCRRFGSEIFAARLLGETYYCMRGPDAARMFYEPDRMTRNGALPTFVLHLLQDEGSVATLDGAAHRCRKAMFLTMMSEARLGELAAFVRGDLLEQLQGLAGLGPVALHDVFRHVLTRTACRWAGIELAVEELADLADELGAMIAEAGHPGPMNWIARGRRRKAEAMIRHIVDEVRAGRVAADPDRALGIVTAHRDLSGHLLAPEVCTVELLNVVRPIFAVARYLVFLMAALRDHPELRPRLAAESDYRHAFVQEVRRLTPFFPVVAGIARHGFDWQGHRFEAGDRFLLDLYGTTHHEAVWPQAEEFLPDRFLSGPGDAYTLIPQGGGDHFANHRCPGEWATIRIMEAVLAAMVREVDYDVPPQDLSVDLSKLPALPRSGFLAAIAAVHPAP
ncbi:cytochrome P450 [Aurantimonas sp. 22II-16-19i]|uniref:cytochrome P450 n=1 Tax=Aurantimonas sp. 22II-16-19i TaxID=1317114 RepID=UPI0009F7F981|nr:cytochrome P450 [Aurantimonas sp. 22II-16-19i]ORE92795.1 fatty acid alpha hydroxylase, cytochrome P450 [Aurantimonas sp. 22II-16-19i]